MKCNTTYLKILAPLLILFLVFATDSHAQTSFKLNKETKIDTLALWINYPSETDESTRLIYNYYINQTIEKSNKNLAFYTVCDSRRSDHSLIIDIGTVRFVEKKENLLPTIGNILIIGGYVAMISNFGWTLPIFLYFDPDTKSEVELEFHDSILLDSITIEVQIASSGYFASKDRQIKRIGKALHRSTYKTLKRINRQNLKNNKS